MTNVELRLANEHVIGEVGLITHTDPFISVANADFFFQHG